jgi:extracellular elastinolytic metalloproteinase
VSREFDRRDVSGAASAAPTTGLVAETPRPSEGPAGAHRVRISAAQAAGLTALAQPQMGNYIQRALSQVQTLHEEMGLAPSQPNEFIADPRVQTTSSGAVAVHLQQQYKSIPIFQAAQTVQFTPNGELSDTLGTTVYVPDEIDVTPTITVQEAALKAAQYLATPQPDDAEMKDPFGGPLSPATIDLSNWTPNVSAVFANMADSPAVLDAGPFAEPLRASLMWFSLGEALRLAWHVTLTLPRFTGQYRVLVDAASGEILYCHQLIPSVAAAGNVYRVDGGGDRQMTVFPTPVRDYPAPIPAVSAPGFPSDWVSDASASGNNAVARLEDAGPSIDGVLRNDVLTFDPSDPAGDDQKILNIFYYTNLMHDYLYALGFREADGNFQANNFGRGGLASDPLDARAYRGAVWATASMLTPADGSSPVMKMGLVTNTQRHTALDSTVVFHEFTHGLTHRLVGGSINDQALDAPQSSGMGEGWSDYVACTLTGKSVVAAWVVNNPGGIRGFPYDATFPDNFGKLGSGRYTEPHNIGELWCAPLLEMNRQVGASLGLQVVADALKLTPANPSFLDGRDAIFAALDHMLSANTLGAARHSQSHQALQQVFAKFGMGPKAQCTGATLDGVVPDFQPAAGQVQQPSSGTSPGAVTWVRIGSPTDTAPPRTSITAVSAAPNRLDLFLVASDGGVYTTSRPGPSTAWADWSRVGTANDRVPLLTPITAISIAPGRLDLFVVAADGGVYTTSRGGPTATWADWSRIGTASDRAPLLTPVAAVSATSGQLDLFLIAADGGVYTTSRDGPSAAWADWSRIGMTTDRVPLLTPVAATSATPGRLDLFLVAADGGIATSTRDSPTGSWADWSRAGAASDRVPLLTPVAATSAVPNRLDLFLVASDGGVYTTSRPGPSTAWADWSQVGTGGVEAPVPSPVSAASATSGRTDLFVLGVGSGVYTASLDFG